MKTLKYAAITVALLVAGQAMAQVNQMPPVVPAAGDYGVYSSREQATGLADPYYTKAYDNFTLTQNVQINGFEWAGIYSEDFPSPVSDTDFIVEIWATDPANNNYADVWIGPLMTFNFEGGTEAGMGGSDLAVTALGYQSPATATTYGGGEAYSYAGPVTPTALPAGDYWISVWADQEFDHPTDFDPEWQWHLGSGPGDGFTSFDRGNDPPGTLQAGIMQQGKDLAFAINVVPEPSSAILALFGMASLGLLRRKRQ